MKLDHIKSAVSITGVSRIREKLMDTAKHSGAPDLVEAPEGHRVTRKAPTTRGLVALPSMEQAQRDAVKRNFAWNDKSSEQVVTYYASDERVDGHGDIVEQSWDFTDFEANPIMLFCHEWWSLPIGGVLSESLQQRTDANYTGPALVLNALFAPPGAYAFADSCARLAKAGFLKAGSVGFWPGEVIDVQDDKERAALGLGKWGCILRNNSLIEWSPCSVPANPGAHQITLSKARDQGLLKAGDGQAIREMARVDALKRHANKDAWAKEDATLRGILKYLFPEAAIEEHKDIEKPFAPIQTTSKAGTIKDGTDTGLMIQQMHADLSAQIASLSAVVNDCRTMLEDQAAEEELEEPAEPTEPTSNALHTNNEPKTGKAQEGSESQAGTSDDTPEMRAALAVIRGSVV